MPNQIVVRPPFRKRGQQYFPIGRSLNLGSWTGSGGVRIGDSVSGVFTHGPQVESDILIEWDLDNDGQFEGGVEDITSYVLAASTVTGRDWPSLLTGRASPGALRLTLDNTDNRFSYFNTSSPLNQSGYSLKTGRRIRIRTTEASVDDPVLYYKDRFPRADGALGSPEYGAAWSDPLANDFVVASMKAKPQTEGQVHFAVADSGQDQPCYVQARFSEIGAATNVVGLLYRYVDTANYSIAAVDVSAKQLKLINVSASVPDNFYSTNIEVYDDITIGVLNDGFEVQLYHEGVLVTSTINFRSQRYHGLYASWGTGDIRPEADDFFIWNKFTPQVDGILWTGDVSNLVPDVGAGPVKTVSLDATGWLDRLAGVRFTPVRSVEGKKTGKLVGNTLARANLLHPPMSIAEGDVTTGPVALTEQSAIDTARDFEETEFGFLKESQEGPIVYEDRTHRDSTTSVALFSDNPTDQFHYEDVQQLDFRRDVVNRVAAGVAPGTPGGITVVSNTSEAVFAPAPDPLEDSYGPAYATMPGTVNAGDLLVIFAGLVSRADYPDMYDVDVWSTPPGWKELTGKGTTAGSYSFDDVTGAIEPGTDIQPDGFRVFVKVADGTEASTQVPYFTTQFEAATYRGGVATVYRVEDWFGSLDGVILSDPVTSSDPLVVFPSWGPNPSLFIAVRAGTGGGDGTLSGTTYPLGYGNGTSQTKTLTSGTNTDATIQTAYRTAAVEVENAGEFGGSWSGYQYTDTRVLAIRGFNGSPPLTNGVVTVQLDDLDSQDDHNAIRTYTNASNLFASEADAETYDELVLARYADDRPILRMTFTAVKSGAYRTQAVYRRVGDRITLDASNNAGLGITGDFFIETISHRWDHGNTNWVTTWDLSPVPS